MGSSMKQNTNGAVINARAATVDTPVYDGPSPLVYKDAYSTTKFYNYDGRSHGVLPLKKAMGNSLNIAAVKVELSIGVPAVLSWMRNLGVIPRYISPDGSYNATAPGDQYGPSLTLGGYPITLLEHVEGIATYADMGVYHTPQAILKVTDSRGAAPLHEVRLGRSVRRLPRRPHLRLECAGRHPGQPLVHRATWSGGRSEQQLVPARRTEHRQAAG